MTLRQLVETLAADQEAASAKPARRFQRNPMDEPLVEPLASPDPRTSGQVAERAVFCGASGLELPTCWCDPCATRTYNDAVIGLTVGRHGLTPAWLLTR